MIGQGDNLYNRSRGKIPFIPNSPNKIRRKDIFHYLQNLEVEIDRGLFSENELLLLQEALYGKFLDRTRRPFFLYHFLPLWMNSVQTLFRDCANPKIIELGCGTGASSLLFAMLGAQVIGIEMNADLVGICNKRKRFYENYFGNINAKFYQGNTFDFPFEEHPHVDGYFSLFAFNLMIPAYLLLARMIPSLKNGGKIMIIDGNSNNFYSWIIPSRRRLGVFSPLMMRKELENSGCRISKMETHCAIPPFIFGSAIARSFSLRIENIVRFSGLHRFFAVSYSVVPEKISEDQ